MKQPILKELQGVIDQEPIDFYVFAKRKMPRIASFLFIFVGIFLILVSEIGKYFDSSKRDFNIFDSVNIIFALIGVILLVWGVVSFFLSGGHFVGTPTRLIHYKKGTPKIYPWQDFTGNVDMNPSKRHITFYLHSIRKVEKGANMYMICDVINLFSADNILEIERISRQRITENKDVNKFAF